MTTKSITLLFLLSLIFSSCNIKSGNKANETDKLNNWLNVVFERNTQDSPQTLSMMGRKDRQSELDDISEEHSLMLLEQAGKDLTQLMEFDFNKLDAQAKLSYRLYKKTLEEQIKGEKYRHYDYPVNQMFGLHASLPSFMLNIHAVDSTADAVAYVSRLNAFLPTFEQLIRNLKIREEKGIIIPKFVFQHLYNDCNNIIGNADDLQNNLFIKDITKKLNAIDISASEKEAIIKSAHNAVSKSVIVAYENLLAYLQQLEKKATTVDGVWRFEDGNDFYQHCLETQTSTMLTADEIYNIGVQEVARIHDEIRKVMTEVNFEGSLQDFFQFMKEDEQFYFEDSDEGRKALLDGYKAIIDSIETQLEKVFYTKPKARVQVKAVESWREKSAGKAFYERPSPDGSRKGTFYANLHKMQDMPSFEMEALAYHEGIPGHHMQISIAQELTDLPEFRKYYHNGGYIEGWGLYCELLPKEMGFYSDPYSNFGRLSMELWRACRLVVDVGIHEKKWSREEAIQYLMENTPNPETSCTKAIERYIVMPGQATTYKVGMLFLLEMRAKAKDALGEDFDIRKFHDIFLRSGSIPLDLFEEQIDDWIASAKS